MDCSHVSFFFNDTATTEIYTLSLHDALPIFRKRVKDMTQNGQPFNWAVAHLILIGGLAGAGIRAFLTTGALFARSAIPKRSEEHTSELQSHLNLVCRLLLEKKKI